VPDKGRLAIPGRALILGRESELAAGGTSVAGLPFYEGMDPRLRDPEARTSFMAERYHVAVVGSGPGGLSAAGRAAEYDAKAREADPDHAPTHILMR